MRSYLSPTPVGVGVGTGLTWAVSSLDSPFQWESGYAKPQLSLYSKDNGNACKWVWLARLAYGTILCWNVEFRSKMIVAWSYIYKQQVTTFNGFVSHTLWIRSSRRPLRVCDNTEHHLEPINYYSPMKSSCQAVLSSILNKRRGHTDNRLLGLEFVL